MKKWKTCFEIKIKAGFLFYIGIQVLKDSTQNLTFDPLINQNFYGCQDRSICKSGLFSVR